MSTQEGVGKFELVTSASLGMVQPIELSLGDETWLLIKFLRGNMIYFKRLNEMNE